MKKILFIGPLGLKYEKIGGAITKNNYIYNYLIEKKYKVFKIDSYWENKNIIVCLYHKIFMKIINLSKILLFYRTVDLIILGDQSLKNIFVILEKLEVLNKTIIFGIGSRLPYIMIERDKYSIGQIKKIRTIFVESYGNVLEFKELGINNVYQLNNFKPFPEGIQHQYTGEKKTLSLLYIGLVSKNKGIEFLIKVLHIVNKSHIKYELYLYGEIDTEMEVLLNDESTKEFTHYMGLIDLVRDKKNYSLLTMYDIFVFPSFWKGEGIPGSLIDALILKLPILASRHNLNSELVEDGINGLLFKSKDSDDLFCKLNYIYENQAMLDEFSRNSDKVSYKYNINDALIVIEKILEGVF